MAKTINLNTIAMHLSHPRFLGIDLGWQSGASGLCCLGLEGDQLLLQHLTCRQPVAVSGMVAANSLVSVSQHQGLIDQILES
jgi:predicted RNase H-like nuclease